MARNHRPTALTSLLLLGLVLATSAKGQSQKVLVYDASQYILTDARLFRAVLGYARFSINGVDTLPDRLAQGLNMRIEGRCISGFMHRDEGFVIADALVLDLTLGSMQSEKLAYYSDPEGSFSTVTQFGYSFLAGYSNAHFGVLGGKSFNWTAANVGGSRIPGSVLFTPTGPWMARLEYRPAFSNEFRIMLTGWNNFNPGKIDQGFRVDIPFLPQKRFFLTYQYDHRSADVAYATFGNDHYAPGAFSQHLFGIRVGSVY